jgi:hypothetical protein
VFSKVKMKKNDTRTGGAGRNDPEAKHGCWLGFCAFSLSLAEESDYNNFIFRENLAFFKPAGCFIHHLSSYNHPVKYAAETREVDCTTHTYLYPIGPWHSK